MRLALRITILILIAIAVISLLSCAEKKVEKETEIQIIDHNLSMHNFTGDVLKSIATVNGRAKNISNTTIGTASITVNFYDKDGNRLNTTSTEKQNLGSGELWIFNVQFNSSDAWKTVRYDIAANAR
jgi:hypothetical protein